MCKSAVVKKSFVFLMIFLMTLTAFLQSSYAYSLFGKKLINGVYNRTYYIGMSHSSYVNPTVAAVSDWNWAVNSSNNGVGTDVYFTRTYTQSGSTIQFWGEYLPNQTWTGITYYYSSNGTSLYPSTSNWYTSAIIFNTDNAPTSQPTKMKAIACHELGHAFGLAHNSSDTGVIMYPYWGLCTATSPTSDDVSGVVALY